MTTIAISGASGFVGGHLCRLLQSRNFDIRPLPRQLLVGDGLHEALQGIQAVVHVAARAHRLRDDAVDPQAEFHTANVGLTRNIAKACRDCGVRRLVFVSSAGVLGSASPITGFTDDSQPAPHDDYTRSKLTAERVLFDEFASDLEVIVLRPPLVYGPGAPGNFQRMMGAALTGWPLPVGRLTAPRSLISVRNLCDALMHAAVSDRAAGKCMLVADSDVTTVADLTRSIAAAAGRKPTVLNVPPSLIEFGLSALGRAEDVRRLLQPFVLKGQTASRELGWVPPYRLAEELDWTVRVSRSLGR